jgi:hypothetical protein
LLYIYTSIEENQQQVFFGRGHFFPGGNGSAPRISATEEKRQGPILREGWEFYGRERRIK